MSRDCGPCTICCQFFAVPETGKPVNQWCGHCSDKGCGIHANRPQSCRNFRCFWLMDESFPEDLRPDLCGVVVSWNEDHDSVVIHLDPDRPDALALPPGEDWLPALMGTYNPIFVVCGDQKIMVRQDLG